MPKDVVECQPSSDVGSVETGDPDHDLLDRNVRPGSEVAIDQSGHVGVGHRDR
jgi:hypothetical protein